MKSDVLMPRKIDLRWLPLLLIAVSASAQALPCAATPDAAVRDWSRQQAHSLQQEARQETVAASQPGFLSGYAVERIMDDPVLGSRWALVADCEHPERPVVAVLLASAHLAARHLASPLSNGIFSPPPPRSALASASVSTATSSMRAADRLLPRSRIALSNLAPRAGPLLRMVAANSAVAPMIAAPVLVRAGDSVILWNQEPDLRLEIAAIALEYGHAGQVIHLRRGGQLATPTTTLTGVVRAPGSVELMP